MLASKPSDKRYRSAALRKAQDGHDTANNLPSVRRAQRPCEWPQHMLLAWMHSRLLQTDRERSSRNITPGTQTLRASVTNPNICILVELPAQARLIWAL